MKNLFKNLMLVAVAAMAFTACTENNDEVNATKKDTVLKFATSFADTRVTIADEKNEADEYPVTWDGDEDVLFDVQDGGMWTGLKSNMTVDADNRNASFEVILSGAAEGATADEGSTIYGYFGKLDFYRNAIVAGEIQTPTVNGVDKSFISMVAEFPVEVEGQMEFVGTFNHKTAYGLITLPASVDAVDFKTLTIKVNNAKEYILNVAGLDTHSYWFACEPDTVTSIYVSAVDSASTVYGYTASGLNKTFVAGTVSKFSIKSLEADAAEPEELDAPVVTSSTNGSLATFSWEAVEHASSYAVKVNDGEFVNVGTVTEYVLDLSTYAPFSTVDVQVKAVGTGLFLDSYPAYSSVVVPISKGATGDSGFDFTYDKVELRGTNKYKFYNSAAANEYMYLSFDLDITALEPGSYTYELYDEVIYGADSAYRHPVYTNGSWVDWYLQGTVVVFVDVADDGKHSITVFCKRWVDDAGGEYLFKGYWSGMLPEEPTAQTIEFTSLSYLGTEVTDAFYGEYCNVFELTNADGVRMELYVSSHYSSEDTITIGDYKYASWSLLGYNVQGKVFQAKWWSADDVLLGTSEDGSTMKVEMLNFKYTLTLSIQSGGSTHNLSCKELEF